MQQKEIRDELYHGSRSWDTESGREPVPRKPKCSAGQDTRRRDQVSEFFSAWTSQAFLHAEYSGRGQWSGMCWGSLGEW